MKPLDPRLLRHARRTAVYIAVLVVLGAAAAGLVIAQAQLLSGAIAGAVDHGATLSSLRGIVLALAAVLAGRALIAWATEATSCRASAAVKSQLRRQVLARAAALGPRWLAGRRSAELTTLATEGIDALDGYFSKYLPQLILAVIVPVAVLIRVGAADLLSGVTILVTLPLIPVFGALVGMATGAYARRRWLALARLSHHFLDVVTGLPTLKVFGRSREQRASIGKVTGEYRSATMQTLKDVQPGSVLDFRYFVTRIEPIALAKQGADGKACVFCHASHVIFKLAPPNSQGVFADQDSEEELQICHARCGYYESGQEPDVDQTHASDRQRRQCGRLFGHT